jgi:hypothetical protein
VIPPGTIEAEVAVRLERENGMVHTVHIRSDHDPPQNLVNAQRNEYIPVIEHGSAVQDYLENDHRHCGRSDKDYRCDLDQHGNDDFDWMKTRACREINVQVGMVHHVQSPENWDRMEHHILNVYYKI